MARGRTRRAIALTACVTIGLASTGGCAKWRAKQAAKQQAALIAAEQAAQPRTSAALRVADPVVLTLHAVGNQVYVWDKLDGTGDLGWKPKGPATQFYDDTGTVRGTHHIGPIPETAIWEASTDGSKAVAQRVAEEPSPEPDALPWLLLEVTTHEGTGVLSNTTYVHRVNTHGGLPPATAGGKPGDEVRVPYTADYVFHAPRSSPAKASPSTPIGTATDKVPAASQPATTPTTSTTLP